LVSANCVNPPDAKVSCRSPSATPLTVTPVIVKFEIGGVGTPLGPKVKLVPTFFHAGCVPVAEELVS
jgi:hypothetical protein